MTCISLWIPLLTRSSAWTSRGWQGMTGRPAPVEKKRVADCFVLLVHHPGAGELAKQGLGPTTTPASVSLCGFSCRHRGARSYDSPSPWTGAAHREAPVGIEPTNRGFADLCLTTWLRRREAPKIAPRLEAQQAAPKMPSTLA